MPEKRSKNLPALSSRPAKHGLYSWVDSRRLPYGRAFQKVRRELGAMRTEMIEARGGDSAISPEQRILIDSIIEALGVQKLLGMYTRHYGVINDRQAKRGSLELSPILAKNWVSYGNVVRQAILALKELDASRPGETAPVLADIIASYDRKAAADGHTPEAEGDRGGKASDTVRESENSKP